MEYTAAFTQQHQALSIYLPVSLSIHPSIHLFTFLLTFVFIVCETSQVFDIKWKCDQKILQKDFL